MYGWSTNANTVVSVFCTTYNHEKYISETIDGFLMQETTFPFEIIIRDDCSSDDTASIIRNIAGNYPNIIKPIYEKENQYSKGVKSMPVLLNKAVGKYIALCDGDDYWIDSLKLQKQVDFMDNNPEFSICWTRYQILQRGIVEDPIWVEEINDTSIRTIDFNNFGSPYCTYTVTSLFRRSCICADEMQSFAYFKDNTLYALCIREGKSVVLDFLGAMYRIHPQGVYSGASSYRQAISNYTNYEEILLKIPESRVPNIQNKRNYWKNTFIKELEELQISLFRKKIILLKLWLYFKYNVKIKL